MSRKKRTIDYKRNIELRLLGTNREGSSSFELKWSDGSIAKFSAAYKSKQGPEGKWNIEWNVTSFHASFDHEIMPGKSKQDLVQLINEALLEFGMNYGKKMFLVLR